MTTNDSNESDQAKPGKFARLVQLINSKYKAGHQEGKYLVLKEESNIPKPGCLHQIDLFMRNVTEIAAFKFDQSIIERDITYECFAPILSDRPGNRSMCDFIVFFRLDNDERIHVWAINMKSTNIGNNVKQLRAAKRVIDLLLGKLEDLIAAETNQSAPHLFGQVDFVLFSMYKASTNASKKSLAKPLQRQSDNTGRDPTNYCHITMPAQKLAPLARP